MQAMGFGNGSSGSGVLTGVDAPVDSSCAGNVATKPLTATNPSFAANRIVWIAQMRGTGVGNWELNIIDSYTAGTITLLFDLVNTYTDSGNSQAQVIQVPEYNNVTMSGDFQVKPWDGNVGGAIVFMCSGKTSVTHTITATGNGFRYGAGSNDSSGAYSGEGTVGVQIQDNSRNANGNGGGGAAYSASSREGGGGGGHGTAGDNGQSATFGYGGSTSGSAALTTMTMGGAGGGGHSQDLGGSGRNGGTSGAIIFIMTQELEISGSGLILSNGNNGVGGGGQDAGGGAGAGGSILIYAVTASIGTDLIRALGGVGGIVGGAEGRGGDGGDGRIAIYVCQLTGSTTQGSVTTYEGGHDWCQSFIHIY